MVETTYIGYSTHNYTRKKATSGGVASEFVRFLFEKGKVGTVLAFRFDKTELKYTPYFAHCIEDYNISGSVYHEVDIVSYIKNNTKQIVGPLVCFVLPCQAKIIKYICKKKSIKCYIIGLVCSAQQSYEATEYLFKRLKIKKENILSVKYRGDGWPSGVKIKTKDELFYCNNNSSIWNHIFHSRLFCLRKCFKCRNTLNIYSDIAVADPWNIIDPKDDHQGQTLFIAHSEDIKSILADNQIKEYINFGEVNPNAFSYSQRGTILRKDSYRKYPVLTSRIVSVIQHQRYKKIVLNNKAAFNIHCYLLKKIEQILLWIL